MNDPPIRPLGPDRLGKQVILAPPLSSVGFLVVWMAMLTWGN
jgi:hypothetical protein